MRICTILYINSNLSEPQVELHQRRFHNYFTSQNTPKLLRHESKQQGHCLSFVLRATIDKVVVNVIGIPPIPYNSKIHLKDMNFLNGRK